MYLTGISSTFFQFLLFQSLASVGLGCIAAIGFSVVSDFIPPHRRGLAMGLWWASQALGGGNGVLLGGSFGVYNWHLPFFALAAAGLGSALLFLFAYEPERGRTEPELSKVFASGGMYDHQIKLTDLLPLFTKQSNIWLILQSFTVSFVYGSIIWMPRLFLAKVEATGHSLETATIVANLYVGIFSVGGYFAIISGQVSDLWQRRDLRGRAMLGAIGSLCTIPLYLALFYLPLYGGDIPEQASIMTIVKSVVMSVFTNRWIALTFLLMSGATALSTVEYPARHALISDVNLPEHRGTVFGASILLGGLGLAGGNALTGVVFAYLGTRFASPLNYIIGMSLFQFFYLLTALCFHQATKTVPQDIVEIKKILAERAETAL